MKGLLPVNIAKMSGAGNTFALIDARQDAAWWGAEKSFGITRSEFARLVCNNISGLSADGLLFIEQGSEGYDFDWDFYNSDGSTAEMCGNAARCAARFCKENLGANSQSQFRFKTGAGLITTDILADAQVRVKMPAASIVQENFEGYTWIDSGVPHLVRELKNFGETSEMKEQARLMRAHKNLGPRGANVTFYAELRPNYIKAVSFERGVEDYTPACGTGAVAAALAYSNGQKKTVQVEMPGGVLEILFKEGDEKPEMTGPAVFVGEFKYNLEVIK